MSMILYLKRASQEGVEALRAAVDQPATAPAPENAGFFSRMFGRTPAMPPQPPADPVQEFFFAEPQANEVIDFDRAWDALNMMLTGEPFGIEGPLAIFYYQGEEIGPDSGYGPARYTPAEKMGQFAESLKDLSDEDIAARFDPSGFEDAQLYSSYLFSEDDVGVDYIMQGIPDLRKFADRCVETNSGALVAIY